MGLMGGWGLSVTEDPMLVAPLLVLVCCVLPWSFPARVSCPMLRFDDGLREPCVWVAFVCCCFACDCVLELVVCRVRFARVSCPWLRFELREPCERSPSNGLSCRDGYSPAVSTGR